MNLNELTAHELLDLYKAKKTSPEAAYNSLKEKISQTDSKVKAYVRTKDKISNSADGHLPIPIAIKDNICIKGREVTCSSKILAGFVSPYDATVIEKLKVSGASFIGQTN